MMIFQYDGTNKATIVKNSFTEIAVLEAV
jgi:hypothetical protein